MKTIHLGVTAKGEDMDRKLRKALAKVDADRKAYERKRDRKRSRRKSVNMPRVLKPRESA